MKRIIQLLSFFVFIFMVYACIPVPVPVDSTPGGYQDNYGYGYGYDDQYIDVPIVYGEPCYYPPPVVVAYPYDYFTYEIIGGFVDIVFWRGGHRYHHEPWYDHGRRVADNDIRLRHHKYPVPWPEFKQHREKLHKNHHISHPDSYYGVKQPPKKQIPQRQDWGKNPPPTVEKQPQWVPPQPQPVPEPRVFEQKRPPQIEKHPQWGQQPPPEEQKPVFEQKRPPQIEKQPQWGTQPPPPQQKSVVEQQQTEKNVNLRKKQLEKQRKAKQKLLQKMGKKPHDEAERQTEKQYRKEKSLPQPPDVERRPPNQEGQPVPQHDIK